MKYLLIAAILIGIINFFIFKNPIKKEELSSFNENKIEMKQENLKNDTVKAYPFLKDMYEDTYFPKRLVDKCKNLLVDLCFQIEEKQPKNVDELYKLTHATTDRINDLQDEFDENDSEIETAARECLAINFEFIAISYGFSNADVEELIATRDW